MRIRQILALPRWTLAVIALAERWPLAGAATPTPERLTDTATLNLASGATPVNGRNARHACGVAMLAKRS
jgi:hypothetical protein